MFLVVILKPASEAMASCMALLSLLERHMLAEMHGMREVIPYEARRCCLDLAGLNMVLSASPAYLVMIERVSDLNLIKSCRKLVPMSSMSLVDERLFKWPPLR